MKINETPIQTFFERIDSYIAQSEAKKNTVNHFLPPNELIQKFDSEIPKTGKTWDELFKFVDFYLEHSVDAGHPHFCNQLFAGRSLPALIGEWLGSTLNSSMYTYEMAPVATLIENQLIKKMGDLAGFTNTSGEFVTGGSNSNLLAMLCARYNAFPDVKTHGLQGIKTGPLVMFTSDICHYSYMKAANAIGLGLNQVIQVNSTKSGKMDIPSLKAAIQLARKNGQTPFMVGATAGTTVRGAFDPIDDIADICDSEKLWLHVDGAFGGSALLSKHTHHLLQGLSRADSFTWDAHKVMGVPLICSVFLLNNKETLFKDAIQSGGDSYIFHAHDSHASFDLGPKSLQCGRKVDVLKLWMNWQHLGDDGYDKLIHSFITLADYAKTEINKSNDFKLIFDDPFLNVCFQYIHDRIKDSNAFHHQLRFELLKNGNFMINQATESGHTFIRLVCVNAGMTKADIDLLLKEIRITAQTLIAQLPE